MRPIAGTYPDYLTNYISQAIGDNLNSAIKHSTELLLKTITEIPEEKGDYAYTKDKWTVKQVLIHISDAERVFSYRLMRFARGDEQQPLPFDENTYAENCNAERRTLQSVVEELIAVRNATTTLINSFSEEDLTKNGTTAIGKISVNALGFAICGHSNHHLQIIKERYF